MSIKRIAIACQGGGSHAAYAAGALPVLLPQFRNMGPAAGASHAGAGNGAAADPGPDGVLVLSGISGTSGGAISALLAWYGFLLGDPDAAREKLERFWHANCATTPGERWLNDVGQWAGNLVQVDLKFSPYLSPLREIETFTAATWPMLTSLWPALGGWIRGRYFQLRESVAPHVDFALVGALGEFCSIPGEIRRWQACALEARMAPDPAERERLQARLATIGGTIRTRLASADWIADWADRHALPAGAPLRSVFGAWKTPPWPPQSSPSSPKPAALERLAGAVRAATQPIPQLLIGAVDIDSGAFVAFSSEHAPDDAGITLDAVVASASLPWVFMAQPVRTRDPETLEPRSIACWDGLFSQNPPIKNFISGGADRARKPDGVWILQINQDRYDFTSRVAAASGGQTGDELWHRRDTLSGNLSLNQEVAFIEAMNGRLDDPGQRSRPHDKPIEVVRIVMDGDAVGQAARKALGLFSKFDRDPGLAQALLAHGREQAGRYLALRAQSPRLWDALARQLEAMGARPSARLAHALPFLPGPGHLAGGLVAPDVITVEGVGAATLRWHASEAELEGRTLRMKGRTELRQEDGVWQLAATRLLDLEERAGREADELPEAQPTQPQKPGKPSADKAARAADPALRRRAGGGRRRGEGAGPSVH